MEHDCNEHESFDVNVRFLMIVHHNFALMVDEAMGMAYAAFLRAYTLGDQTPGPDEALGIVTSDDRELHVAIPTRYFTTIGLMALQYNIDPGMLDSWIGQNAIKAVLEAQ